MMSFTIPETPRLREQANAVGFLSVEQYVMDLLARDADRVAILQGLVDLKAGCYRTAADVEAERRREAELLQQP